MDLRPNPEAGPASSPNANPDANSIPALEALGHEARAIDLPGHGEDKTPADQITLDACRAAICAAAGPQTILVGHSWGGVPIGVAAEAMDLRGLVFLCAYVPRDGLSMSDLRKALPKTWSTPTMSPYCADTEKYAVLDRIVDKIVKHAEDGGKFAGRDIATVVTVLGLFCIIPAAYAFARFEFPARNSLLGIFIAVNMFSGAVLIIPLFKLMQQYGLLNTYFAMIAPGTAFVIPTGIWLLRSYLIRIPKELEEAAWVDGAGKIYTLWRVIIPVALPGIVVVTITAFITAYAQQFIYALTFNSVNELNPLPVGLFQFFGRQTVVWNELMAASLVGILPVLFVYVFLQRFIVAGLTAGAVKE